MVYDGRAVREVIREVQSSQCPPDARQSTDADIGRRLSSTAASQSTSMPSPSSTRSDGGAPASRSDMLANPSDRRPTRTGAVRRRPQQLQAWRGLARARSSPLEQRLPRRQLPQLEVVNVIAERAGAGAKLTRRTPSDASTSAATWRGSERFHRTSSTSLKPSGNSSNSFGSPFQRSFRFAAGSTFTR